MASSVNVGPLPWMDGPTFSSQVMRTLSTGATFFNSTATPNANTVNGGVIPGSGEFAVTAGSGMSVNMAAGNCLIPSSAGATQGGYLLSLMTNVNLSIATSDPTNPRIDLVCATAVDNGNSTSYGEVQVVTGTPAPSPAAPSLPSSSIGLYTVTVPAGASSSSSFTIASILGLTVPAGGVMPVYGSGSAPQGYTGHYIHDRSTGRLLHNAPTGPAQPQLLPFAGITVSKTSSQNILIASEASVLSTTVATDGSTDLEITLTWSGIYSASSAAFRISMRVYIDSYQAAAFYVANEQGDNNNRGGASGTYFTSSGLGTTPSAGTHTIKWAAQAVDQNGAIYAASFAPMIMRVKPVCK